MLKRTIRLNKVSQKIIKKKGNLKTIRIKSRKWKWKRWIIIELKTIIYLN